MPSMRTLLTCIRRSVPSGSHGGAGRFALVVAMVVLLAATLAGCGTPGSRRTSTADAVATVATADLTANEPRIFIKRDTGAVPFNNGDSIAVSDLNVEIYVAPYPMAREANFDFYVTRGGTPVEANVTLQYDMTVMDHGPFQLMAVPTGAGHYLAPVEFIMSGDFWINVAVSESHRESLINLLVRARR